MNFLGVDGGGTSTEFIITDDKGNIKADITSATAHFKQTSIKNFKQIMNKGIIRVCEEAEIEIEDINYSVLGIPGYGEYKDEIKILDGIIEEILGKNHRIVNDAVVGWAGSLACEPGINIVAGTGTIGYGVDRDGTVERSGGWGHFCGDEGSGFWIGKKVIENFTKSADGRLEKGYLYELLKRELNIVDDFQILDIIIDDYNMERNKVAKLAAYASLAANNDDKKAKEILKEAAYEQSLMVKALLKKLNFKEESDILVSYSGGVYKSGKYILDPLKKYLMEMDNRIIIKEPELTPILGAVLYANLLYRDKNKIDKDKLVIRLSEQI